MPEARSSSPCEAESEGRIKSLPLGRRTTGYSPDDRRHCRPCCRSGVTDLSTDAYAGKGNAAVSSFMSRGNVEVKRPRPHSRSGSLAMAWLRTPAMRMETR